MTQPPPPPPGNYPPPPQGGYPPPPPAPGPVLPREAYTHWIKRVGANLVDSIPVWLIIGIGLGIGFGTADNQCVSNGGDYEYGVSCTSTFSAIGTIFLALSVILAIAYWVWNWGYREGTTGSTIGKSLLKFKVVSEKTWRPIGFGMSIVRQFAHIVDGFCYLGYLWPLWDAKRQTFADKIMSTVCVPLNPQPLPPGPPQGPPQ
jgi:uncharacterized RDD family membrane protein YckC